jgi:hypothetical protein
MGGTESFQSFEPVGANKADIEDFVATGYKDASLLFDAGTYFNSRSNGQKLYQNKLVAKGGGQDLTSMWADFNNWLTKRNQTNTDHQTYLDLKAGAPGRSSTIVGFNQEKQGTVIGNTLPYPKTVLG